MGSEIKKFIETCDVGRAYDKRQPKEMLISHEVPERPWAKVGIDLFSCRSHNYLICVDYYSSFREIDLLEDTRSATVIRKLKAQFARHGIPEVCVSDNGPQFISDEFKELSRHWGFAHMTTSPIYPRSNGKVDAAVKSAKAIMKKSRKARMDPFLALLEYRNTPGQGMDSSPVVRLMSRRIRTQVPTLPQLLKPVVDHNVHDKLLSNKEHQAGNYNKGAKDLAELKSGDTVHLIPPRSLTNEAVKAIKVNKPVGIRSYKVITVN